MNRQSIIEKIFESFLWNTRLGTIIAVIFSALGSLAMFVLGSIEIFHAVKSVLHYSAHSEGTEPILISVIGAIDLYLIGVVLILFSFGIYELFISKLDIAHQSQTNNILNIESLDELKNKVLKVIIMVLIVSFSKAILSMTFNTPIEMLYFAVSVLAVSGSVYLIRNKD